MKLPRYKRYLRLASLNDLYRSYGSKPTAMGIMLQMRQQRQVRLVVERDAPNIEGLTFDNARQLGYDQGQLIINHQQFAMLQLEAERRVWEWAKSDMLRVVQPSRERS